MIQRIKNIMSTKNLTSSGFADKVGVPRSTISHIISGRNKPSLELVQKILDAFPDVSTEWLVRGSGTMAAGMQTLFSQEDDQDREKFGDARWKGDVGGNEEGELPAEKVDKSALADSENQARTDSERKGDGPPNIGYTGAGKRMVKLVAMFDDGTFSAYLPSE